MKFTINQNQLESICSSQKISYLGVFGSQIRDDARLDSDIDLLVDFEQTKSYFELARVQEALENFFKKKVDLVLRNNIKSGLKSYIFSDLRTLYEKR